MAELCPTRMGCRRRRNSLPTHHPLSSHCHDLTDILGFDSEDIDGMDDDAGDEQEPPPTGRWTATYHMTYTWWIHPERAMAKRQRRMHPPSNPSANVSGAALSPTIAKTAITAQEDITVQSTLEETTTAPPRWQNTIKMQTANVVRIRRPNTVTPRINLIKPRLGRKTVRTKMHTSSRKRTWSKRTSAEGLLPQRGF